MSIRQLVFPHTVFPVLTVRRRRVARLADMLDPCRRTGAEADTAAAVVVAVVAEAVSASVTTGSAPEDWTLGYYSVL